MAPKTLTSQEWIKRARSVHGTKYQYLSPYTHSRIKLSITCPKHGCFLQYPYSHLAGSGCKKCDIEYRRSLNTTTPDSFTDKANQVHHHRYTYPDNYVHSQQHIIITCTMHGNFTQLPYLHLLGHGCSKCSFNTSTIRRKYQSTNTLKSWIYLLKITIDDTDIVKIGITKNVKQRLHPLFRFNPIILCTKQLNYKTKEVEQCILQTFHDYKINIKNKFSGYTECFKYDDSIVTQMINIINQT